jgi:folate-binding protein YgfZ
MASETIIDHAALGANMTELDGRPVAADYGDPAAEQARVRAAGGFVDRSYRGKLRVTGPDREDLLQSMTTNDVAGQPVDTAIPDAICTGHGKVQSLFTCLKRPDAYLLDLDPVLTAFTRDFLVKYTIIRDAETADETDRWGHVGVYGPKARAVLAAVLAGDLHETPGAVSARDGGATLVLATAEFGVPGFEVWTPRDALPGLWDKLTEHGAAHGVEPIGFTALEGLRVEAGRPRYGLEVDDDVILLEAGLVEAANFEKGCYIGQETLSRIVFRGHVNKRLCGLVVEGPPPAPGTAVTDGDAEVGTVRSAVVSPTLGKTIALAYLKRTHWEVGTAVQVGGAAAAVADLPFV